MKNVLFAALAGFVIIAAPADAAAEKLGCLSRLSIGPLVDCALTCDSTVKCWGKISSSPQMAGWDEAISVPGLSRVVQINVGMDFACALTEDKEVFCWSYWESEHFTPDDGLYNACTEYAENDYEDSEPIKMSLDPRPTRIPELDGTVQIANSNSSFCVRSSIGAVRCWGYVFDGEENFLSPRLVPGLDDAVKVALTDNAVCAILIDGQTKCWSDVGRPAVEVDGLENAADLEALEDRFIAIRSDGTAASWEMRHLYQKESQREFTTDIDNDVLAGPIVETTPGVADAAKLIVSDGRQIVCAPGKNNGTKCWRWADRPWCFECEELVVWSPDEKLKERTGAEGSVFHYDSIELFALSLDGLLFYSNSYPVVDLQAL